MIYRTTVEADRDIIEIYVLGAQHFGVAQSERYVDALFDSFEVLAHARELSSRDLFFGIKRQDTLLDLLA